MLLFPAMLQNFTCAEAFNNTNCSSPDVVTASAHYYALAVSIFYGCAAFISLPVLSFLAERVHPLLVINIALAGVAVDFLLIGFWVQTRLQMVIVHAICGLGGSQYVFMFVTTGSIARLTKQARRTVVFGVLRGLMFTGVSVGPVLGGFFADQYSNRAVFKAAGVGIVVLLVIENALIRHPAPLRPCCRDRQRKPKADMPGPGPESDSPVRVRGDFGGERHDHHGGCRRCIHRFTIVGTLRGFCAGSSTFRVAVLAHVMGAFGLRAQIYLMQPYTSQQYDWTSQQSGYAIVADVVSAFAAVTVLVMALKKCGLGDAQVLLVSSGFRLVGNTILCFSSDLSVVFFVGLCIGAGGFAVASTARSVMSRISPPFTQYRVQALACLFDMLAAICQPAMSPLLAFATNALGIPGLVFAGLGLLWLVAVILNLVWSFSGKWKIVPWTPAAGGACGAEEEDDEEEEEEEPSREQREKGSDEATQTTTQKHTKGQWRQLKDPLL